MGHLEGVSRALDDTRSSNERERVSLTERHVTDRYLTHGYIINST